MQALLQNELGDEFVVESAGVSPKAGTGEPANEHSILCMSERGIDISKHVSRWVHALNMREFSHIVCVDGEIANEVSRRTDLAAPDEKYSTIIVANGDDGGVPNPFEKGLQAYRDCLALLDNVMPNIAAQIRG